MIKTIPWQRVNWRRLLGAALLLGVAALLAACGPLPQTATPGPTAAATPEPTPPEGTGGQGGGDLGGSAWELTALRGQPLLEGTQITLEFKEDGVGGFAGCNSYGSVQGEGELVARDGELRLPPMAQTLIGCIEPEGIMDQESAYMEALQQATGYRLEGDVLELQDDNGETILTFRRQEELTMDPGALAGTAWRLVTMNGQPPAAGSTMTLAFQDENRASGHAGCRDYVLGYEASEEGISFYYTAMIGWVCVAPGSEDSRDLLLTQEGAFTDALSWTDRFRLAEDGGSLELLSQRGESLVFEPLPAEALPPVEGPTWVLLSFVEPNTQSGLDRPLASPLDVIAEAGVTLELREGTAAGTSGCNQYSAGYSLEGTTASIVDPVSTEMFCGEPEGVMEQEQRYLTWLAEVETAQVHGRQLWLETADGRALVFHAPEWE